VKVLAWELDFKSVDPPAGFTALKELLSGYTFIFFEEIERSQKELARVFEQPNPHGVFKIELVFKEHPNSPEIETEFQRLVHNVGEWIEDY